MPEKKLSCNYRNAGSNNALPAGVIFFNQSKKMFLKLFKQSLLISSLTTLLVLTPAFASAENDEVLATIGKLKVTASELETAINSSPFATQFVAMDEDEQASLRGGLLQRIVAARLLRLEAEQREFDQQDSFIKEIEDFRIAILYRHYLDKLREKITIPEDELAKLKKDYLGNADALAAAKSTYISERYQKLRMLTIKTLRDSNHVIIHEDRLAANPTAETVVMEGDKLSISYGDLINNKKFETKPGFEWLQDRLYKRAELLLIARAAEKEGVDVSNQVESYKSERLPSLLIEQLQTQWAGDETVLKDYYDAHPEIAKIAERRHIGQLVLATQEQADAMRKRIEAGESLFTLAGQFSIDPYGREHNGDMGWLQEGSGTPEIEQALSRLENAQISPVIKTSQGYHLVTIVERRPGGIRSFEGIKDRIRQSVISEHLIDFVNQLGEKFTVTWNVVKTKG